MIARLRLYSSGIALAGVVLLVAGLGIYLIGGALALQNEIPLALGLFLLLVALLLNPNAVRKAITGRQARYGGNALLLSLTFIAILGLVNFLAARHHKRFDLTAEAQFSLSPQTIQVLKALDQPVKITAFMQGGYNEQLQDLLTEYSYYTSQIQYEIVDPDRKPTLARQYAISSYGTIVYECGAQRQDNFGTTEQDMTTAIIKVTDTRTKVVYFLTGHGEPSIDDFTQTGLSSLKEALERDSYEVQSLNLAITDTVPSDIVALVIDRPTQKLLDNERTTIIKYLLNAGKVFIAQDPGYPETLNDILSTYHLAFDGDVIIDPNSSLFGDVGVPVVQQYPYNIITQGLSMTLYPQAQSIKELEGSDTTGLTISQLVQSSSSSWGETDLSSNSVRYDASKDIKGPLNIAMTVEAAASTGSADAQSSPKSRLVVVGDSDFMGNSYIGAASNLDLALNSINWLAEQENLVSIRAKDVQTRQLILTAGQARVVMYSSMIFLPLLVLAIGVVIWWNRR